MNKVEMLKLIHNMYDSMVIIYYVFESTLITSLIVSTIGIPIVQESNYAEF